MMRRLWLLCLSLLAASLLLTPAPAQAHKASDSYLSLAVAGEQIKGQWDIALRDLDLVLDLDQNRDGNIDWGEVRRRQADIADYALGRLELKPDAKVAASCKLEAGQQLIDRHSDGAYVVMMLTGSCPSAVTSLTVNYKLLFEVDALHRGLLKLSTEAGSAAGDTSGAAAGVISAVFPVTQSSQSFVLAAGGSWATFLTYVADGVKHIAIGIDHILFLVALLLPAVLVRTDGRWQPVQALRPALYTVAGIVTAFTLAHSITLSLATLGVVQLPSRWVESGIAASVLLTALDNLRPFLPRRRWIVAFAFGLLHGFGFASVLLDLKLPAGSLLLSLLGFNLGVELGQLILVALLVPLAYWSRRSTGYRRLVLQSGSLAIAAVSLGWLLERSLNLQMMPF